MTQYDMFTGQPSQEPEADSTAVDAQDERESHTDQAGFDAIWSEC